NRGSGVHRLEVVGVEAPPAEFEETGMLARIVLPGAEEFEGDEEDERGDGKEQRQEAEQRPPGRPGGGGDAGEGAEEEGHGAFDEGEALGPEDGADEEGAEE